MKGVLHLEFLKNLYLTLNFIGFARLDESVDCMKELRSSIELSMVGNPCTVETLGSSDNDSNTSRYENNDVFVATSTTTATTTQ